MDEKKLGIVFLKGVRICYAQNIFKKSAFKAGQEEKYNAQFIIPKSDKENLKAIQDAISAVAKDKWTSKWENIIKSLKGTTDICLRDGEQKPDREELADAYYVAASNRKKPTTINRDRSEVTAEDDIIYSGCYVNAKIDVYGWEVEGKKQINATLLGVQFVKDGDAFAGGGFVASADEFDDISNTGDADTAADDGSSLY